MRNLLQWFAAAMRREPPAFKWVDHGPASTDPPPREQEGRVPDLLDRLS